MVIEQSKGGGGGDTCMLLKEQPDFPLKKNNNCLELSF